MITVPSSGQTYPTLQQVPIAGRGVAPHLTSSNVVARFTSPGSSDMRNVMQFSAYAISRKSDLGQAELHRNSLTLVAAKFWSGHVSVHVLVVARKCKRKINSCHDNQRNNVDFSRLFQRDVALAFSKKYFLFSSSETLSVFKQWTIYKIIRRPDASNFAPSCCSGQGVAEHLTANVVKQCLFPDSSERNIVQFNVYAACRKTDLGQDRVPQQIIDTCGS